MKKQSLRAFVSGRVQGVGFRYFTGHQAQLWGLDGYAKNLSDGRVEVFVSGELKQLEKLQKWLESGPQTARVDSLQYQYEPFVLQVGFNVC